MTHTALLARIPFNTLSPESQAYNRGEVHPAVLADIVNGLPIGTYVSGTTTFTTAENMTITGAVGLPGGATNGTTFTEPTNGATMVLKSASVLKSALSGATVTATNLIPAGAIPMAVVIRVTTLITGASSFKVGDGTTADLWGATVALTAGTTTTGADFKATFTPIVYPAATSVVLTANTSNFTAGAVRITVFFWTAAGPTS